MMSRCPREGFQDSDVLWSHGRGNIKGDNFCHIAGVASGDASDLIFSCTNEGQVGTWGTSAHRVA